MEKKITIIEAIKKVMQEKGTPMTTKEIYDGIISAGLYIFHTDNPVHVIRSQIRRHCKGIDFPSSSNVKHFELRGDNKYFYLEKTIREKVQKREKVDKSVARSSKNILEKIKDLHNLHRESIKSKVLGELKKLSPSSFELFSRNFLNAYGFQNMKVTQISKDGGIDGFGKLKIGLTYLNVAVQCKRWSKGKIGRTEIDKFRGAIQGEFEQGILITTTSFSHGAEKVSFKPGAVPIILIDGNTLVELMIEKGFGVQKEELPIYSLAIDLVLSNEN